MTTITELIQSKRQTLLENLDPLEYKWTLRYAFPGADRGKGKDTKMNGLPVITELVFAM